MKRKATYQLFITHLLNVDSSYKIAIIDWMSGNKIEAEQEVLLSLDKPSAFAMIGTTVVTETIVEDNKDTTDVDETETQDVLYLIYFNSDKIYKLKIGIKAQDATAFVIPASSETLQLTSTTMVQPTGMLLPEVVGNYLFMYGKDIDKNVYLYKVDLTKTEKVTDEASKLTR